jgi:hypothetical protein
MIECFIPDGLNCYEVQHPNKAVIFNVSSEDVIMIEKDCEPIDKEVTAEKTGTLSVA